MTRAFFKVLLVVAIAIVGTGCNKNTPKEVAEKWLIAFHRMDAETSLKLSAPATKNLVNTLNSLSGKIADTTQEQLNKITVAIKDVKQEGDKAVVTYTTSDNAKERTLNLVRQNDRWLVLFTKTDLGNELMNTEEEAPEEAVPAETDTTAAQPAEAAQ